jgi:hypothetical protein
MCISSDTSPCSQLAFPTLHSGTNSNLCFIVFLLSFYRIFLQYIHQLPPNMSAVGTSPQHSICIDGWRVMHTSSVRCWR